jgi:hypothetical protein
LRSRWWAVIRLILAQGHGGKYHESIHSCGWLLRVSPPEPCP